MSIRILLADDHQIVREGLRALIEQQPDMEVVGEVKDGRTAVRLARDLSPDLVVMDISMPDLNGIEAARQIVSRAPGVKVIALSMYADRQFVAGMLSAGASGYLLKNTAFKELADAIRAVAANQVYLSPVVAGVVVQDSVRHASGALLPASSALTAREREVLQLLAEGKLTKQIASHLQVTIKTIEAHRHKIMQKLNLHSVAELTKYAIVTGLTFLEG